MVSLGKSSTSMVSFPHRTGSSQEGISCGSWPRNGSWCGLDRVDPARHISSFYTAGFHLVFLSFADASMEKNAHEWTPETSELSSFPHLTQVERDTNSLLRIWVMFQLILAVGGCWTETCAKSAFLYVSYFLTEGNAACIRLRFQGMKSRLLKGYSPCSLVDINSFKQINSYLPIRYPDAEAVEAIMWSKCAEQEKDWKPILLVSAAESLERNPPAMSGCWKNMSSQFDQSVP